MQSVLIKSIGRLVSGNIANPLLDADSILILDGLISEIGRDIKADAETIIDARGSTVIPGLIDSHVHPVFGDFSPKQTALNWIEGMLQGGVTRVISAGEVHLPGRPRDVVGVKALAILAAKSWATFRPGGVKVHAGAPILERGLQDKDFAEMAAAGVKLIGEVGLGSINTGEEAAPMIALAKRHGMTVTMHTGGPSPAGSTHISGETVRKANPDVIGHINGGTTSVSPEEIDDLVATDMAIEIVHNGNIKMALHALQSALRQDALDRVIVGTDSPTGTGSISLGILRMLTLLAGVGGLDPSLAVACASGNTARVFKLNSGRIEKGCEGDLVICDAPIGSTANDAMGALVAGDIPGISMILIDGKIVSGRSRNTPWPQREPAIFKGMFPGVSTAAAAH
jgi:enamidase